MKVELIGSRNLYNEIKANVSRKRAVLISLSYIIIALAPELLHCLVDATVPLLNKLRAQVCDEMSYSIPTADSVTLYSE